MFRHAADHRRVGLLISSDIMAVMKLHEVDPHYLNGNKLKYAVTHLL